LATTFLPPPAPGTGVPDSEHPTIMISTADKHMPNFFKVSSFSLCVRVGFFHRGPR
jgi:hypothetical protein